MNLPEGVAGNDPHIVGVKATEIRERRTCPESGVTSVVVVEQYDQGGGEILESWECAMCQMMHEELVSDAYDVEPDPDDLRDRTIDEEFDR